MLFCLQHKQILGNGRLFWIGKRKRSRSDSHRTLVHVEMDKIFDVEHQFSCYGGYRKSKIHVMIHAMFVWPMFFGILLLLSYSPAVLSRPAWVDRYVPGQIVEHMNCNYAFVAAALYSMLYIHLDALAGSLAATLVMGCWIGASAVSKKVYWDPAWKVVMAAELVCFTAQTIGRGPPGVSHAGIVENFGQMLVLGPFFIMLEVLEFVGYLPYEGFGSRVPRNLAASCCQNCCEGQSSSSSDSDCCG